jgi:hypothetical protein
MITLNKIKKLLTHKKRVIINYSDIPYNEQKIILEKSVTEGNRDQKEIIEKYNRKFKTAN